MEYDEIVNEFGTKIPEHVVKKAKELGCKKPDYVYKDGEWKEHGKFPASNINIKTKSARFKNARIAEAHKVKIVDGWVAFKSPSGSGSSKKKRMW
jgi:hypothetical protein